MVGQKSYIISNNEACLDIWTIKISCAGAHKTCEINSTTTLDELCDYILNIFEFDNDHMHRFVIGKNRITSAYQGEEISDESLSLDKIFPLEEKHSLFLHFDFGDDWLFKISKTRKKAIFASDKTYPCIIKEMGENPEQYPMYEEDNWD